LMKPETSDKEGQNEKGIRNCPHCGKPCERIPLSPTVSDYVCWNCDYSYYADQSEKAKKDVEEEEK